LPLVLVSIVANTLPLVTAVLAYMILGEHLIGFEKICIILSFAGVAIMVTGRDTGVAGHIAYPLFAVIALVLHPIF
jgi:drug/metabolite transporter (DMT)-like permease